MAPGPVAARRESARLAASVRVAAAFWARALSGMAQKATPKAAATMARAMRASSRVKPESLIEWALLRIGCRLQDLLDW
jgi:hypothetical protein